MLRNLYQKTIRDQRKSFMFWSIALSAVLLLTILIYPSFEAQGEAFGQSLENMPEPIAQLLVGETTEIFSPAGYLNSQLFVSFIPFLFIIFGINRGSATIVAEEDDGTMDLLLSYPISRQAVVFQKFLGLLTVTATLSLVLWGSVVIGVLIIGMDITIMGITNIIFSNFLLALLFATLSMFVGCAKSNRSVSVGLSSLLAIASYMANALAPVVSWIEPTRWLSPFYYYIGADPLLNGLNPVHTLVLFSSIIVLLAASLFTFSRRDIAG